MGPQHRYPIGRKLLYINIVLGILLFVLNSFHATGQVRETRALHSVQVRDTSEGTLVTITEMQLGSFVTRKNGLRFQLIVPRAGASVTPGYVYRSVAVIVHVDRKDNDAIFTFDLSNDAAVGLKHDTEKIEVLITPGIVSNPENPKIGEVKTQPPAVEKNQAAEKTPVPFVEPAAVVKAIASPNSTSQPVSPSVTSSESRGNRSKTGTLAGKIVDPNNSIILGASIILADERGARKALVSNGEGEYSFTDVEPGVYSLLATADGFQASEVRHIKIDSGQGQRLNIKLEIRLSRAEVTIAESPLRRGLTTRVLRGKDLETLPNTPGGLAAALRALAIRSGGPRGPQILVDGFSGGRLPPKESIREIRINENPFSAEYPQMGLARIEIFTKPGTDKFHASAFFNFNDESLNSRNPFAASRAPFQSRLYGGNVSGPLVSKRGSFFLDFERQEIDDNALINATIVDSAFNVVPFNRSVVIPQRKTIFSPRFDYQFGRNHTLVGRYSYTRSQTRGEKVGDFSLPERAVNSFNSEQRLQLTETSILGSTMVNETLFQFARRRNRQEGNDLLPVISVPDAFVGGGSDFKLSRQDEDFAELQNYTTWTRGKHDIKFGGQFRWVRLGEYAPENFSGTFTFAGGVGPQIDSRGQVVIDPATGLPTLISLSGIERYRRTLLLRGFGLSVADIRARGGGATQFSIAAGNPEAEVVQNEIGGFIQDDWRLRPNFTLSYGVRFEAQSNVKRNPNVAPRLAFVWAPGAANSDPKTVIRGGGGLFYDRFGEDYVIEAKRFNGLNQQQFIVAAPSILDLFPVSPTAASLASFAIPQSIRQIADGLRSPYSTQLSFSLERQLPHNFSVAATFVNTRSFRVLRSRNVNAPLVIGDDSTRPIMSAGEIFRYESNGRFNQNQLVINTGYTGKKYNFYTTYLLSDAMSDTEGANSFPAYQYDLGGEYGRSSLDIRHQFYFGGWVSAPWGVSLNPLIFFRSGTPFNIITGRDTNGDRLYTERPAFATDLNRPSVVLTSFGAFDLDPIAGQSMIPRNYGRGSSFFSVNLGISKTFTFVEGKDQTASASKARRPLSFTFSLQMENLLNRINAGLPVGNLSSALFGRSQWSAGAYGFGSNPGGNRRIEIQIFIKY